MYFRVDNEIIDKYGEQLGAYGLAVYMCLARFTNQEMVSWPSYETIAKRTGISRRKVITEVAKLVELGLVEVTPQYNPETKEHRSNLFTLTSASYAPPPSAQHAPPDAQRTPNKYKRRSISPKKKERSYQPDYAETDRKKYSVDFA